MAARLGALGASMSVLRFGRAHDFGSPAVEPDATHNPCDHCGAEAVIGAEELILEAFQG